MSANKNRKGGEAHEILKSFLIRVGCIRANESGYIPADKKGSKEYEIPTRDCCLQCYRVVNKSPSS